MILCVLALCALGAPPSPDRGPVAGTVVLESVAEPRSLDGEWLFSAGDDPAWADPAFDDHAWQRVQVPRGIGAQGHADLLGPFWYRLHIQAPASAPHDQLAVQIWDVDSAYELYIDGVRVGVRGSVVPEVDAMSLPLVWPLPRGALDDGVLTVAIRGARSEERLSAAPTRGGVAHGPNRIGPTAALSRGLVTRDIDAWFLVGSFVVVGVYHLQLFRRRRELREYFWFGLFSLLMSIYVISQVIVVREAVGVLVDKLSFAAVFLALPTFQQFLWPFLRQPIHRAWRAWQITELTWTLVCMAWPTDWFIHRFLLAWEVVMLLPFMVFSVVLIATRAWRGDPEARTLLLGTLLLVVTSANNILRTLGMQTPEITNYAFAGFVLAMAASLSNRFTRVYNEVDHLLAKTLHLSKLKDEFLANTSHELRTPLNAIINIPRVLLDEIAEREVVVCSACGSMFEQEHEGDGAPDEPCPACEARALTVERRRVAPEDPEALAGRLNAVVHAGEHLLEVVTDILDASKIAAGGMEFSRDKVSVGEVVARVIETVDPMARAQSVALRASVPAGIEVTADRTRLTQVVMNLVSNAVKFSPAGAVVDVEARALTPSGAELKIIDRGVGIAPEHHVVIFEAFRQVDAGHTRKHGGTGLGLAIARQLVELHGGTLTVESALGKGSTFTVRLP